MNILTDKDVLIKRPALASQNSFTDDDLQVANHYSPPQTVEVLNNPETAKYNWKLILTDISNVKQQLYDDKNTALRQPVREGTNSGSSKIFNAMQSGIRIVDVPIVCNLTKERGIYANASGYGRYWSLYKLKFTNIMIYVPERIVPDDLMTTIASAANDHLPQTSSSKADIKHTFIKQVFSGRISGINKELASKYYNCKVSNPESEQYIKCLKSFVKKAAKNNHGDKAISTMISEISELAKNNKTSDTMIFLDQDSLSNHLRDISHLGDDCNPDNLVNPIIPLLNDGTRQPANNLGAIVNRYVDVMDSLTKSVLVINGDDSCRPETVSIVIGLSKWEPTTPYTKMKTIKKTYIMERAFWNYLAFIEDMVECPDLFNHTPACHDMPKKPKIGIKGFINPWQELEQYGWPFARLITWNDHRSFNEVVELMCNDGLITTDERDVLKR